MDLTASSFLDTPKNVVCRHFALAHVFPNTSNQNEDRTRRMFSQFCSGSAMKPTHFDHPMKPQQVQEFYDTFKLFDEDKDDRLSLKAGWIENFEVSVFVSSWISDLCAPGIRHFIELPWTEPH